MFNIGAFLTYSLAMIFSPGPNNILAMASGTKYGYKKTLRFILGVFTGFLVIMILCSFLNFLLFKWIPKVDTFMSILGAGYMVYLAISIMRSSKNADDLDNEQNADVKETTAQYSIGFNSYISGIAMQFINPKTIIFCITIVSNFIIPYYNSSLALFLFSLSLALTAALSTFVWALFGSIFKKILSDYEKQFNITMGLLLIYSAVVISGITDLFK